jgi:hypothetical protein
MEAASFLKSRNPHSVVEVKDLKEWKVTAVALQSRLMAHDAPCRPWLWDRPGPRGLTVFCGEWILAHL